MVLHLLDTDVRAIAAQLQEKFGEDLPPLLRHAPLLIETGALREEVDFPALVALLRERGLVPVALRGGSPGQQQSALEAGIGVLPAIRGGRADEAEEEASPEPSPARHEAATDLHPEPARIVSGPVRSGQRLTAEGDLVVLSSVSPGAEIVAGGNIHIYGALRGRALAGARGDGTARIFCLQFIPELVAVAGEYLVNEEITADCFGKAVQVSLEGDSLKIDLLGTAAA